MNIAIGMDFGTNFTYIGFVHGKDADGTEQVRELVPAKYASKGIPSVYWNDGKNELFGNEALKKYKTRPEFGVVSIKSKLMESKIMLGDTEYTPAEIVRRMLTNFLETAEAVLREQYVLEPTSLDIILTVPVDFDQSQVELLRRAIGAVALKSGTAVYLKNIVQEPVASAVRFLGIRAEPDEYTAVFDLGGGTLDVAVVHYEPDATSPYRVVDQGGDRTLGGDQWDERMTNLLKEAFEKESGSEPDNNTLRKITAAARSTKEDLSDVETTSIEIDVEGDYLELSVDRASFEKASQDLADRAVEVLKKVLERQKDKKIRYLILTGGGSRMPQIQNAIRNAGILPANTEMRCFNPEKSIAEGAAILSSLIKLPGETGTTGQQQEPEPSVISNIAPHGYGLVLTVPQRNNETMIRILFKKNTPLTASGSSYSQMGNLPEEKRQNSVYTICETDVLEEGTDPYEKGKYILIDGVPYTALYQGREVLEALLTRPNAVDAGTPATETLSMNQSMQLNFTAEDTVNNTKISREIDIKGKTVKF